MKYRLKYRLKDRELQRKLDALSNGDFSRQLAEKTASHSRTVSL